MNDAARKSILYAVASAICLSFCARAYVSATKRDEAWYRDKLAAQLRGGTEAVVPYGRADVTTAVYAIEIDYLAKFKEGVGQALWYGWCFDRRPGLALIAYPGDLDAQAIMTRIAEHSSITLWLIDERTGTATRWR